MTKIAILSALGNNQNHTVLSRESKKPVGQVACCNKEPVGQVACCNKEPVGQVACCSKEPVGKMAC